MLKFTRGELVLHPFFGAGTVKGTKKVELSGDSKQYYTIELITGGTLMVPLEQAEKARLHPLISPRVMTRVLSSDPQELADDFRKRQEHVASHINSGDPKRVAAMLRDLTYRSQSTDLSLADKDQLKQAKKLLVSLLVAQLELELPAAGRRLEEMLNKAIPAADE